MSEYGQSLHQAVFGFPLRAAFALAAPRRERHGAPANGPSRADEAGLAARARVKDWLAEHFTIRPVP